jgi:hypothetical protein
MPLTKEGAAFPATTLDKNKNKIKRTNVRNEYARNEVDVSCSGNNQAVLPY